MGQEKLTKAELLKQFLVARRAAKADNWQRAYQLNALIQDELNHPSLVSGRCMAVITVPIFGETRRP
jgi:hypothetical protein